jgi:ankyrin repeat protein
MFRWLKNTLGGNRPPGGVEGLAALLNGQRGPGGIENFAAMLNGMGEAGGGKLAELFNNMNDKGAANYAGFLNRATSAESQEFSRWIEGATPDEILKVANFLNRANPSDVRQVMTLIRARRAKPNATQESRASPTYSEVKQAVVRGDVRTVSNLLRDGFDVNARNEHGETMLLHALCMGDARLDIAELLVTHGANVNATVHGKTLLRFIRNPAYCDNERTIAFLLRHGATEGDESRKDRAPAARKETESDGDMVRFQCPQCTKRLKVVPRGVGKLIRCPKCGQRMQVPDPGAPNKEEAVGAGRPARGSDPESGPGLRVGVLVLREGEYPPADERHYCRDVARLKYGRTPDHLEAAWCVGLRPGVGLDYAYALGIYARLRETGRLPDLGDLKDHFVGDGPDGRRIVALFF